MLTRGLLGLLVLELATSACGSPQSQCSALTESNAVIVAPLDATTGHPLCSATVTIALICDAGDSCQAPMTTGPNGQCSYFGGLRAYPSRPHALQVIMAQAKCNMAT